MTEYTASNGIGVRLDGNDLDFKNGPTWLGLCGGAVVDALREFFEWEPKPWNYAKPGEVWEITHGGNPPFNAWRLESGAFMFDDESFVHSEHVTAGRRVWPHTSEES
jgi:hypothetical protein